MLAITVTASAFGVNLWGWVPKWTDEVLSFSKEDPEEPVIKSIPMVLQALEITEPLYPTWLPEGFVLVETIAETDPVFLHDAYTRGDDYLSITITPSNTYSETFSYQKDNTPFTEYFTHDTCHYLFSDLDYCNAIWNTENYTVQLYANISFDEVKRIIDSVYEVQK
jgi:hypothetical protein